MGGKNTLARIMSRKKSRSEEGSYDSSDEQCVGRHTCLAMGLKRLRGKKDASSFSYTAHKRSMKHMQRYNACELTDRKF